MKKNAWFLPGLLTLAVVISLGFTGCGGGDDSIWIPPVTTPTVATPVASPAGGTTTAPVGVPAGQPVTLSCATDGAAIYYTTNDTTPTKIPANLYSGAITVNEGMTIKAIAGKDGYNDSGVLTAVYSIDSNKSVTPTVVQDSVEKIATTQKSVTFTLNTVLTGTWKVYAAATGDTLAQDISATASDTTLTLTHTSDIPAGTYYVSLTQENKTESGRVALTVRNYVEKTYTVTASGSPTTTSLIFTFSAPVTGLTADAITLTNDSGQATKGTVSGSGTSWTLTVSGVRAGTIKVKITKTGIEDEIKTVTVSRTSNPIATVYQNANYNGTLSDASNTNSGADVSFDTITGKEIGSGPRIVITDVSTSGGTTMSYNTLSGRWDYIYQGTTKIGIAFTTTGPTSGTSCYILIGKMASESFGQTLSLFGVTAVTNDITTSYSATLYVAP